MKKDFDFDVVGKKGLKRIVVRKQPPKSNLTQDHIIPRAFFRELKKDNIRMINKKANEEKGSKLTKEAIFKILNAMEKFRDPNTKIEITIKLK